MNTKFLPSTSILLVFLLASMLTISGLAQFKFGPAEAAALDGVIEIDLLAVDSGSRIEGSASLYDSDNQFIGRISNAPGFAGGNGLSLIHFEGLDTSKTYKLYGEPFRDVYLNEFYDGNNSERFDSSLPFEPILFAQGEMTKSVDITFDRSAVIAGKLVDGETGDPIPSRYVSIEGSFTREYTDFDGRFQFADNLYSGPVTLTVETQDKYSGAFVVVDVTKNQTSTIEIPLSQKGIVSGRVTDLLTNEPLSGVRLFAYDGEGRSVPVLATNYESSFSSGVLTDENGNYEMYVGDTGDYFIKFSKECSSQDICYSEEFFDDAPNLEGATAVSVIRGGTTQNIDAVLTRMSILSGVVTAADTNNPKWALITAYDATTRSFVAEARASLDDGTFELNVPQGQYVLEAKGVSLPYLDEYYDGKDFDSADVVTVGLQETISNLNFTLDRGGSIVGHVIDNATNDTIPSIEVLLFDSNKQQIQSSRAGDYDNNLYKFNGLKAGTYYVGINNSGYAGYTGYFDTQRGLETATAITLALAEDKSIDIQAFSWAEVSGVVTDSQTGQPVSNARVFSSFLAPDQSSGSAASDYTNEQGEYTLRIDAARLPSAGLALQVEACTGFENCQWLDTVYGHSETSQEATFIKVENEEVYAGIDFSLDQTAEIKGIVKDLSGSQFISGTVKVFDIEKDLRNPIRYESFNCSGNPEQCEEGFSFKVPEGDYHLKFESNNQQYSTEYLMNDGDTTPLVIGLEANQVEMFEIKLQPTGGLTGKITDAANQLPVQNGVVFLYDVQAESFIPVTSAEIDANGEFTFKYLDVGTYKLGLEFETDYPNQYVGGANDKSKATVFEVNAGETSDVEIAIEVESILDLTFLDSQTKEEIDSTRLYVNIYDEHGEVLYRSNGSQFSTVDGKITVPGLMAGNYHLWVFDENGGYTAGYHSVNAHDKTQTPPITVSAFETKIVTIELTPSGKIQGSVTGLNNAPVSRATVYLYLVDNQCGHRHRVTDRYVDADGTFEFDVVIPGAEYEVEVSPWEDSEYGTFKSSNIIVDAGETATVEMDLTAGGKIDVTLLDGDTNEEIGGYVQIYRKLADTVRPYFFQPIGFITIIPGQEVESPYLQMGEYYFSVYSGEDYDPLSFDRESPVPFQIKDGETSSISFSLNKSSSATNSGGVEGYVFTADKGEGLQYVDINAYQLIDGELALMGSGESERSEASLGKYRIDGLADGEYYIEFKPEQSSSYDFESEHYRSTWLGGVQNYQDSQPVIVTNGEIASGISLGLELGGSIKAESKQPAFQSMFNAANAVSLFDQDGNLVRESIDLFYDHEFLGLWPGDYYVLFNDYRFTTEMGCNPKIYYGEWYDESSTFEDATPITISGTGTVEALGNLSLSNPPPSTPPEVPGNFVLTGRVVDASDNPIEGVTVRAQSGREASNIATTNANGEYTLYLRNGTYTVTFAKAGFDFTNSAVEVTVDGSNQNIEEVKAPEVIELTPTPVPPTPIPSTTPTPATPIPSTTPAPATPVPTETPEPPAEGNDTTIYLPVITR